VVDGAVAAGVEEVGFVGVLGVVFGMVFGVVFGVLPVRLQPVSGVNTSSITSNIKGTVRGMTEVYRSTPEKWLRPPKPSSNFLKV
jgi:hypothetical protein